MSDKNNTAVPETLDKFTLSLIQDLNDLREGKITVREARVRADLAREVLRSVHLQLEGMKAIAGQAKTISGPSDDQQ